MTPQQTNLSVSYHVETGCLGAEGEKHLPGFHQYLNKQLNQLHGELCLWNVQPLIDIHSSHFQYYLQQKKLNIQQAAKYLQALNTDIRYFENTIDELVTDLIDDYLKR